MERTDEQKLFADPIRVTLGGTEYEIPLLVIREAREWRKKFAKLIAKLPKYVNVTTDDAVGFEKAIDSMVIDMQDEMIDLFFDYAKNLDRDYIESTATEVELAAAIKAVMEVALPLVNSVTGALNRMAG